jgi:enoyl-[acyl-carrier protein] reductase I
MTKGGSILTLTYYGSDKVFPNYNIMGPAKAALESIVRYLAADLGAKKIRVNAISAGPIKTLAARGISDFTSILTAVEQRGPLHRNVETTEVGNTALFLTSDLSSGITGEVTFVDCGYNVTGL